MTKRISIIGASTGVGLHCVHVALERGHFVTSLSRTIERLPAHERLRAHQGSATSADVLRHAINDADAVIVALGTGMDRKPTTLYTDFARALLSLQPTLDQVPVQILTGFGAGDSAVYQPPFAKLLFRLLLRAVYENKSAMEHMIEASLINWSFVRPGLLTNTDTLVPARVQAEYQQGMRVGAVSRIAVARFLVEQAEEPGYQHRKPALSSK